MGDLNNDIERYLKGEMTPAEMHALEKKALSDPFLADALEGAASVNGDEFLNDARELNEKIRPRRNFTLRIAAVIALLIGFGLYLLWPSAEQTELARKEIKQEEKQEVATDTIVKKEEQITEEPQVALRKSKKPEKEESEKGPAPLPEPADTVTTISPAVAEGIDINPAPSVATHVVSGTVTTSDDGLPLPGVTIMVKGTSQGTTTDVAGNYAIEVPDTSHLVFSFVGMQTKELTVADKRNVDMRMMEDATQLAEVVIARNPVPKQEGDIEEIKLAEPVGGLRAYDKYLNDNKTYPQQALDADVKGRVIIAFDVGIRGELTNFSVIRGLGYGCEEEVIRLIKQGPAWNPTTEANVPVESTVHVKMKFDAVKFKKKR